MKIELNDPAFPKGKMFHINSLGSLENGKITDFSDEEVAAFEAAQGRTIQEAFANSNSIKLVEGKAQKEVSD